jgi:Transposase DDE domain group 1
MMLLATAMKCGCQPTDCRPREQGLRHAGGPAGQSRPRTGHSSLGPIAIREGAPGWLRSPACAKDTGLRNLPLHGFAQNQIWCEFVAMACELTAWMQMFARDGARRWEPKRLRLRLFSVAGRLARGGHRLRLRIAATLPGPATSPPPSPACRPSRLPDQRSAAYTPERTTQGPVEPRPPARQPSNRAPPDAETAADRSLSRPPQERETSRLGSAMGG